MKCLFIGGTGNISLYITRKLLSEGHTVYLVNRGQRKAALSGDVHYLTADINARADEVERMIEGMTFDVVADFIAFTREQAERDFRLFNGKTRQYMVLSSASAYQKPLADPHVTESTPLCNPYWAYSRNKIAIEEYLNAQYRECGFPVTIVRPSHTYGETYVPLGVEGNGGYSVLKRMLEGKPVIVHGDGTSLWAVTHSSDFAKGFVGLMGNIHAIGQTVHITTDELVTWNQIYAAAGRALGVEPKIVHVASEFLAETRPSADYWGGLVGDKAASVIFDNARIKSLVPDFCCTVRMDQGVPASVRYIMAHPELQREDPDFDAWCDRVIDALEEAKRKILE